jgi:hypothetical protein
MLRWFCGHSRRDRVWDKDIRDRVRVAPSKEKLIQHRLRWFGYVQRRPLEAPVHSGVLKRVDNVKRGGGRPKLTWGELVKRDLREWNISNELAMDRSAWRLPINVPEPLPLFLFLFTPISTSCVVSFFVFLLPLFLLDFISNLSQLAWDKTLYCHCNLIINF